MTEVIRVRRGATLAAIRVPLFAERVAAPEVYLFHITVEIDVETIADDTPGRLILHYIASGVTERSNSTVG